MRSKNLSYFLILSSMVNALPALAAEPTTQWVLTLSGGAAWENAGETQTLNLQPGVEKTYSADNDTHALGQGELFIGMQHGAEIQGQFGLALALTGDASLSGNIWDDADPAFNNHDYSYLVQHSHIAAKGKLLMNTSFYWLTPYISGSLGVGFNRSRDYSSTPTIFQAQPLPDFKSETTTAFTYTLGVGVQIPLHPHVQVGVGYEFADWGRSQLGRLPGQTTNDALSLNHLYTNGLMFNLTWSS